jgi:hypothetical protein
MPDAKEPTPAEKSDGGMGTGLVKVGQIAGAITAVITAGVLIWTQVKPTPPPAKLKARVTDPTILPNRPWLAYFNSHPGSGELERQRAEFRAHGLHDDEINQLLQKSGFIFEFKVEVEAPPGREFSLTTELYRMPAEVAVSPLNGSLPSEHLVRTRANRAMSPKKTAGSNIQPAPESISSK